MSTVLKLLRKASVKRSEIIFRQFHKSSQKFSTNTFKISPLQVMTVIGGTVALYTIYKTRTTHSLKALKLKTVNKGI